MIALLALSLAHAACTVIGGVTVHLPEGPARGRTVVIDGPQIAAVGTRLDGLELELGATQEVTGARWKGADCTFVQGGGHELTPGLVAVDNQIGILEIGMEGAANDADPHTSDPVRAALRVADSYDPYSVLVGVNRIGGVTHALVSPRGGELVQGQSALVRFSGATQADAVLDRQAVMSMAVPSGSWAEGLRQIRELLADVSLYARDRNAFDGNRQRALFSGASALDLAALVPVVRGEVPVLVGADRASEIEALLDLADEVGLKLILKGGAEAWLLADRLAEAEVPVLLAPYVRRGNHFDARKATEHNAERLVAAGVDVMFAAKMANHGGYLVRHVAGDAVRSGLAHADAVRSLTEVPARVFGLQGRGRVEVGAPADLVLWTGDPLEATTLAEQVWIDGRALPMESRQTMLRDRYLGR